MVFCQQIDIRPKFSIIIYFTCKEEYYMCEGHERVVGSLIQIHTFSLFFIAYSGTQHYDYKQNSNKNLTRQFSITNVQVNSNLTRTITIYR